MSRHEQLTASRRLLQQADTNANRLLRIMFKAVMPVGVFEGDREQGVAREGQPLTAGCHVDHAVPWGVAAGELDDHAWCHLDRKSVV